MHTLLSPIILYELCTVATLGHPEPILLRNHVRIVALTPDLQRVSFYSVIDFLYYSFYYRAYTIPNTHKGVIRVLRPHCNAGNRH